MYILVTYDIVSDKKRRKIDKILSSYGHRVNFSVFEIEIKRYELEDLKEKLSKNIDKSDSVRLYFLNKTAIESAVELNPKRENPFSKESSYVI